MRKTAHHIDYPDRKKVIWEQKIAYDPKLKRLANPEIQRKLGCASTISYLFPKETWLSIVTPKMLIVVLTEEEIEELIDTVKQIYNNQGSILTCQS
jgi:hypothetical protein